MFDVRDLKIKKEKSSDSRCKGRVDTKAVDGGFAIVVLLLEVCPVVEQIFGDWIMAEEHRCVQRCIAIRVGDARIAASFEQQPNAVKISVDSRPAQGRGLVIGVQLCPSIAVVQMGLDHIGTELANRCPDALFGRFAANHFRAASVAVEDGFEHHQVANRNERDGPDDAWQQNASESMPNKRPGPSFFPKHRREKATDDKKQRHAKAVHPRLKNVNRFVGRRVLDHPRKTQRQR